MRAARDAVTSRTGHQGSPRRRAAEHPALWVGAGLVFLVNSALSAAEGRWLMSLLQALTAVLAGVLGAETSSGSHRPRER